MDIHKNNLFLMKCKKKKILCKDSISHQRLSVHMDEDEKKRNRVINIKQIEVKQDTMTFIKHLLNPLLPHSLV